MKNAKPIAFVTTPKPAEDDWEETGRMFDEAGYLFLYGKGPESIRVMTAKKMGRADYRACVNAAKAILKASK